MITKAEAMRLVESSPSVQSERQPGEARELAEGWFFPLRAGDRTVGCLGLIVNKRTGALFSVGSELTSVERALDLYDRGYQFARYDLTILEVRDQKKTVKTLDRIEAGIDWKVSHRMSKTELGEKIDRLPCVFENLRLHSHIETLEKARDSGWFTYGLAEHVSR